MKNKKRVLSIILAVLLTVGAIIPTTFSASEDKGYIDEDCSVKNTYDEENITYSSEKIEIYYDELTLEYLKAEALKEYWAEQKEILETCLDYINNETSTRSNRRKT